jgi:subtilisin family serine protease
MATTKAEKANLLPWLLQEALFLACQSLDGYFDNSIQFEAAFGSSYDQVAASELLSAFAQGNFDALPEIKILSNTVLGATNGAFAAQKNEIYLNERFLLANSNHIQAIANVLIEEIGHFIDAKINTGDSAGDEGEIFAKLVQGESISQQELLVLKGEDDTTTVSLEGHVVQIEQNYAGWWNIIKISAPDAWALSVIKQQIIVGVIDTGLNSHQDIKQENVLVGLNTLDAGSNDVRDVSRDGHGTGVAGIINAVSNGTAKILPIKFTNGNQTNESGDTPPDPDELYRNAADAISLAVDNGAKILNLSFCAYNPKKEYYTSIENETKIVLERSIEYACTNGVLLVVGAGNDGKNIDNDPAYPASFHDKYNNIIVVTGVDKNDMRIFNSVSLGNGKSLNYGPQTVDLSAPGVEVKTISSTDKDSYIDQTGSSFATPHVAGAAALLLAKNPWMNPKEIKDCILAYVDPIVAMKGRVATNGRLNVLKALEGITEANVINEGRYVMANYTNNAGTSQARALVANNSNIANTSQTTLTGRTKIGLNNNSFLTVITVDGTVSNNNGIVTVNGAISPNIGGIVDYTLFNGSFTINTNTGIVGSLMESSIQRPSNEFTLLGLNVEFKDLSFKDKKSIELGAKLTAPELGIANDAAVTISPIIISTDGVSVGQASIAPWKGNKKFNALGLITVELENPALSFDFHKEIGK